MRPVNLPASMSVPVRNCTTKAPSESGIDCIFSASDQPQPERQRWLQYLYNSEFLHATQERQVVDSQVFVEQDEPIGAQPAGQRVRLRCRRNGGTCRRETRTCASPHNVCAARGEVVIRVPFGEYQRQGGFIRQQSVGWDIGIVARVNPVAPIKKSRPLDSVSMSLSLPPSPRESSPSGPPIKVSLPPSFVSAVVSRDCARF